MLRGAALRQQSRKRHGMVDSPSRSGEGRSFLSGRKPPTSLTSPSQVASPDKPSAMLDPPLPPPMLESSFITKQQPAEELPLRYPTQEAALGPGGTSELGAKLPSSGSSHGAGGYPNMSEAAGPTAHFSSSMSTSASSSGHLSAFDPHSTGPSTAASSARLPFAGAGSTIDNRTHAQSRDIGAFDSTAQKTDWTLLVDAEEHDDDWNWSDMASIISQHTTSSNAAPSVDVHDAAESAIKKEESRINQLEGDWNDAARRIGAQLGLSPPHSGVGDELPVGSIFSWGCNQQEAEKSIVKIQAVHRGRRARRAFSQMSQSPHFGTTPDHETSTSFFDNLSSNLFEMQGAATKMQALRRGQLARRSAREERSLRAREAEAARKVQALRRQQVAKRESRSAADAAQHGFVSRPQSTSADGSEGVRCHAASMLQENSEEGRIHLRVQQEFPHLHDRVLLMERRLCAVEETSSGFTGTLEQLMPVTHHLQMLRHDVDTEVNSLRLRIDNSVRCNEEKLCTLDKVLMKQMPFEAKHAELEQATTQLLKTLKLEFESRLSNLNYRIDQVARDSTEKLREIHASVKEELSEKDLSVAGLRTTMGSIANQITEIQTASTQTQSQLCLLARRIDQQIHATPSSSSKAVCAASCSHEPETFESMLTSCRDRQEQFRVLLKSSREREDQCASWCEEMLPRLTSMHTLCAKHRDHLRVTLKTVEENGQGGAAWLATVRRILTCIRSECTQQQDQVRELLGRIQEWQSCSSSSNVDIRQRVGSLCVGLVQQQDQLRQLLQRNAELDGGHSATSWCTDIRQELACLQTDSVQVQEQMQSLLQTSEQCEQDRAAWCADMHRQLISMQKDTVDLQDQIQSSLNSSAEFLDEDAASSWCAEMRQRQQLPSLQAIVSRQQDQLLRLLKLSAERGGGSTSRSTEMDQQWDSMEKIYTQQQDQLVALLKTAAKHGCKVLSAAAPQSPDTAVFDDSRMVESMVAKICTTAGMGESVCSVESMVELDKRHASALKDLEAHVKALESKLHDRFDVQATEVAQMYQSTDRQIAQVLHNVPSELQAVCAKMAEDGEARARIQEDLQRLHRACADDKGKVQTLEKELRACIKAQSEFLEAHTAAKIDAAQMKGSHAQMQTLENVFSSRLESQAASLEEYAAAGIQSARQREGFISQVSEDVRAVQKEVRILSEAWESEKSEIHRQRIDHPGVDVEMLKRCWNEQRRCWNEDMQKHLSKQNAREDFDQYLNFTLLESECQAAQEGIHSLQEEMQTLRDAQRSEEDRSEISLQAQARSLEQELRGMYETHRSEMYEDIEAVLQETVSNLEQKLQVQREGKQSGSLDGSERKEVQSQVQSLKDEFHACLEAQTMSLEAHSAAASQIVLQDRLHRLEDELKASHASLKTELEDALKAQKISVSKAESSHIRKELDNALEVQKTTFQKMHQKLGRALATQVSETTEEERQRTHEQHMANFRAMAEDMRRHAEKQNEASHETLRRSEDTLVKVRAEAIRFQSLLQVARPAAVPADCIDVNPLMPSPFLAQGYPVAASMQPKASAGMPTPASQVAPLRASSPPPGLTRFAWMEDLPSSSKATSLGPEPQSQPQRQELQSPAALAADTFSHIQHQQMQPNSQPQPQTRSSAVAWCSSTPSMPDSSMVPSLREPGLRLRPSPHISGPLQLPCRPRTLAASQSEPSLTAAAPSSTAVAGSGATDANRATSPFRYQCATEASAAAAAATVTATPAKEKPWVPAGPTGRRHSDGCQTSQAAGSQPAGFRALQRLRSGQADQAAGSSPASQTAVPAQAPAKSVNLQRLRTDVTGTWSYGMLVTGRSGVYEVRRVDDVLIFEEGMGSEFRFGELETEGGWMVGNLRCTSGESQGTIRLRLEGTSMTSQFKAPGESVWGSKLVAQRSQAGEGN